MLDRPLTHRVLWAATAVCLVAGIVAAAVVGNDSTDAVDAGASSSATTTTSPVAAADAEPGGTTAEPGGSATGETAPGDSGQPAAATTAPAAPASTAPGTRSVTATVPKAGLYRYRFNNDGEESEATIDIEDEGAGPRGTRKLRTTTKRDRATVTDEIVWSPDEVRTATTAFSSEGLQFACDWEPDHLERPTTLHVGLAWTSDTSCALSGAGASQRIERHAEGSVLREERIRVGGRDVESLVLRQMDTLTAAGRAQPAEHTIWYSPQHGLALRIETSAGGETATMELKSLEPS